MPFRNEWIFMKHLKIEIDGEHSKCKASCSFAQKLQLITGPQYHRGQNHFTAEKNYISTQLLP